MMNLSHWRLVIAIGRTGTISSAAERVGMTQSGASQALAQLEKTLGGKLFTRNRQDVTPTALGEQILKHAQDMLESFNAIRTLADDRQGLEGSSVRIGCFPSIITTRLVSHLARFRQRYPGIDITLLEGSDSEVDAWLESGTIDLGVTLNPSADRHALMLGSDAWVVLVPNAHPMARRSSELGIDFASLTPQPYIHATGGCHINGVRLAEEAGHQFADIRVEVQDWASACALVREGMGVAIVPESVLPKQTSGLRHYPLSPHVYRYFGLVARRFPEVSKAVEAFWQHMVHSLDTGRVK
ncbi:LysR family transcriptional regulator [Vreelandella sp. EE7]